MLCICYVYVMCMLFVCNMMSTASAPWNLQENKVPDVFWAHAPARTRAPSSALDVLSGSERTERAEPRLRGTARKTLISQRSDERNRPVTDLSQTCHSPRMGSQCAQCGKWPFNHFGCMLVNLIIFGADFRWLLMAFESDWMLFHIAPDPFKFVICPIVTIVAAGNRE